MNNYRYLWEGDNAPFTLEKIVDRLGYLTRKVIETLSKLGLELGKDVVINDALMENAVLDYFADIERVKTFHTTIKYSSTRKILGYGMFWFVRRGCVQLVGEVESKNLSINEKIATNIIMAELLDGAGIHKKSDAKDFESIKYLSQKIQYSLTYRLFTQQTLELMLDAFDVGSKN